MTTRTRLFLILAALLLLLAGCGKGLPDPVERKNGAARIPIDGLVFVIPEKSWLRGYSRNSTDGSVYGFTLHAAAPNVEPWSPANDARMYKVPGWGTRIEVMVTSNNGVKYPKQTEAWVERGSPGCHFGPSSVYQDSHVRFCETKHEKIFGYLDNDMFHYKLICDSDQEKAGYKFLVDPSCMLNFYYRDKLNVRLVFAERYLPHAFEIARKVETQLQQFDQTGVTPATPGTPR